MSYAPTRPGAVRYNSGLLRCGRLRSPGGPPSAQCSDGGSEKSRNRLCAGRKFDRFARSTRHLLTALEEFNHLGVRFVSVQDQIDTDSPMGRAMFTIIGAMAELELSLISERVTAGMRAAETRGKHLGRPATPQRVITEIETLATSTNLSVREIRGKSQVGQAADWSARSPNAPATPRRRRCDNFLHVCSGYPYLWQRRRRTPYCWPVRLGVITIQSARRQRESRRPGQLPRHQTQTTRSL